MWFALVSVFILSFLHHSLLTFFPESKKPLKTQFKTKYYQRLNGETLLNNVLNSTGGSNFLVYLPKKTYIYKLFDKWSNGPEGFSISDTVTLQPYSHPADVNHSRLHFPPQAVIWMACRGCSSSSRMRNRLLNEPPQQTSSYYTVLGIN